MGLKSRKCKTCGRPFVPKGADDRYCSPVCRATGCFVGGGGDQTKPMSQEMKKAMERKGIESSPVEAKPKKVRGGAEKFPRVHQMFDLPIGQRWELAKTFTKEEAEYSRRLARKRLQDEWKIDRIIDWDGMPEEGESLGSYEGIAGGRLGDSDDGTI